MSDIEQALIGQILHNPLIIDELQITEELFPTPKYGMIFRSIAEHRTGFKAVDRLEVFYDLEKTSKDTAIAFISIQELSDANAAFYVGRLRDDMARTKLASIVAEAQKILDDHSMDIQAAVEKLMDALDGIVRGVSPASVPLNRVLVDYLNELQKRVAARRNPEEKKLSFQIPSLDEKLDPIRAGEVIVIAGRPGAGKTALALQLLRNAVLAGIPSAIFSLEMRQEEVLDRLVAQSGAVRLGAIRGGYIANSDIPAIEEELGRLSEAPLAIHDDETDIRNIRSRIRRSVAVDKLRLAIIDYLGLVDIDMASRTPRWQQIGEISRQLKLLAQTLGIVIVEVVQMNRDAEGVEPTLGVLRDSGSIEQDADRVILLYEKNRQEAVQERQVALLLAKNRHGPTGKVHTVFDGAHVSFREE